MAAAGLRAVDEPGEQALAYIREYYGVPAEIGRVVTVNGDHGVIVGGQDAHLLVDFGDGVIPCHPTWRVDYGTTTSDLGVTASAAADAHEASVVGGASARPVPPATGATNGGAA
jgi:hypothetical protein